MGLFTLGPLLHVPAVIFGHLSRGRIRRSGGMLTGEGMALAGLIISYIGLALVAGLVVLLLALR